jgi:hypothetical protein
MKVIPRVKVINFTGSYSDMHYITKNVQFSQRHGW